MAVRRVRNINQTVGFEDVVATTLDNMMSAFASKAIQGKNRIMTRSKPSAVTTYVGGQQGRDEFTVKPGESIRYTFDYLKKIVIDAHRRLKLNSPVQTGPDSWGKPADKFRYIDSHILICNGVAYDDPLDVPEDAQEVIITNLMPYARKVEMRGWKGTVRFHAPYHTYELTATDLKKYARFVNIKFTFIDMPGFGVGKYVNHRLASRRAAAARYPALIISVR